MNTDGTAFDSSDINEAKSNSEVNYFLQVEEKKQPFFKRIFAGENKFLTIPLIILILGVGAYTALYFTVWNTPGHSAQTKTDEEIEIERVQAMIDVVKAKVAEYSDEEANKAISYIESELKSTSLPRYKARLNIIYADYLYKKGVKSDAISKFKEIDTKYLTKDDKYIMYKTLDEYYNEIEDEASIKENIEELIKVGSDERMNYFEYEILPLFLKHNYEEGEKELARISQYATDKEISGYYMLLIRDMNGVCEGECKEKIVQYVDIAAELDPENEYTKSTKRYIHEHYEQ